MDQLRNLGQKLTGIGVFSSHPAAFLVIIAYGVLWFFFERETLDWHGFVTLVIWVMTLLIQRATHRDTQAIQAKLDELLRAQANARDELTRLDKLEPEEIEEHRLRERGELP